MGSSPEAFKYFFSFFFQFASFFVFILDFVHNWIYIFEFGMRERNIYCTVDKFNKPVTLCMLNNFETFVIIC